MFSRHPQAVTGCHGPSRRAAAPHRVRLRPAVTLGPQIIRLRPAPHCRTPILSYSLEVDAEAALHQLAAGPVRQLPRAPGLPGADPRFRVEVDLVADMAVINPFDFFLEDCAETVPFAYEADCCARSSRPISRSSRPGRCCDDLARQRSATRRRHGRRSWSTLNRRLQQRRSTTSSAWSPASRRREETLSTRARLLPRHRLAAGADPAPSRPRGALRLRLPDPARARREAARRPGGRRQRLHRPARLGRGLPAGRGWVGLDPTSGLLAGEGHIPLAGTADPISAAPITGSHEQGARSSSTFDDGGDAHRRDAARHQALQRRAVGGDRRARRRRSTRGSAARRRAPHHGRRADLRLDRRHGRRGMEHRRPRPDQAPARRGTDPPAARALRAGRPAALTARANGIRASRCRAGRSAATGARTASRSGSDPDAVRRRSAASPATIDDAAALHRGPGAPARPRPRQRHRRPTRTPRIILLVEQQLPVERRRRRPTARRPGGARAPRRVFEQGLGDAGRLCAAAPGLACAGPRPRAG